MRQLIMASLLVMLLGVPTAVRSQENEPAPAANLQLEIEVEDKNPWTHLEFANPSRNFQFAVVGDRSGGIPGTVEKLNLLQPEFVLSVGDQIDGEAATPEEWNRQWADYEKAVGHLKMPLFFCVGDRDVSTTSPSEQWRNRFGRSYYSFRYQDVLFLVLNTEDLPEEGMPYQIGTAQQRWAIEQLNNNRDARWTFVIVHMPTWTFTKKEHHPGKLGWESIEDALQGRSYTVFAGHLAEFARYERKGMEYYHLGAANGDAGSEDLENGKLDHIIWITMSEKGPVIAILKLNGILPNDIRTLPDPKREK